jgi:hypothetical protein
MCSPMERQVRARDRRRSSVGPARGRWCVVVGGACSLSRQVIGRTRRGAEHRVALAARACAVRRPARPHLTRRSPPMCAACPRVRHAHRHRHCRDRGAEHRCTAPRGEQAMARACSATVEYITPVYLNLIGDHDWHGLRSSKLAPCVGARPRPSSIGFSAAAGTTNCCPDKRSINGELLFLCTIRPFSQSPSCVLALANTICRHSK